MDRGYGTHLRRVPERRTGSVRFNIPPLVEGRMRTAKGRKQHQTLRRAVWRRETRGPPITSNRAAAEQEICVAATLHDERTHALGANVAIGTRIQRLATPVH